MPKIEPTDSSPNSNAYTVLLDVICAEVNTNNPQSHPHSPQVNPTAPEETRMPLDNEAERLKLFKVIVWTVICISITTYLLGWWSIGVCWQVSPPYQFCI